MTDSVDPVRSVRRWTRVAPGLYSEAGWTEPTSLLRARAAARVCDRAVISHAVAAQLHGLPTLIEPALPCLTVPAGTALRCLENVHLHRAGLDKAEVSQLYGEPVTAVPRTVVDVARAALRLGMATSSTRRDGQR